MKRLDDIAVGEAARASRMAGTLVGSQILKVAGEIREIVARGRTVCNLTVGDFSPAQFPIPTGLRDRIIEALRQGETNYPPSAGLPGLRESIREFYRERLGLDYPLPAVLVTGGARPGIYATFRVLCDPGDRVVFPVPSWNNDYYCHMVGAQAVPVATSPETEFLPTRDMLALPIRGARMLALNSPLNPTGTCFEPEPLAAICDLVLEENARRERAGRQERPLYLLYDQVYWMLTFGATQHVHPVELRPEIAPYTIYIDGISKPFASTGLRVGWVVGPEDLVGRMSDFLGHVGSWAPRPEQLATAELLRSGDEIESYHRVMKRGVEARLDRLFAGLMELKMRGLPADAFPPMGAIYLSARFDLIGRAAPDGHVFRTNEEIRRYLLHEAGFAAVAFQAFGVREETGWFRLSVGAVSLEQIEEVLPRVQQALERVQ